MGEVVYIGRDWSTMRKIQRSINFMKTRNEDGVFTDVIKRETAALRDLLANLPRAA